MSLTSAPAWPGPERPGHPSTAIDTSDGDTKMRCTAVARGLSVGGRMACYPPTELVESGTSAVDVKKVHTPIQRQMPLPNASKTLFNHSDWCHVVLTLSQLRWRSPAG